jgi:hypothetical protein
MIGEFFAVSAILYFILGGFAAYIYMTIGFLFLMKFRGYFS